MTFYLKTSLLTLIFATAVSGSFAAPTVRAIGGSNTVVGAGSNTSARAGSLRSGGGYVRPTTTTSAAVQNTTAATQSATSGSSVSAGTPGLNRGSSTTSRLSIGKYIGAPRSISTDGVDVTGIVERIERLETTTERIESTTERLETEKQNNLKGTEFITVDNDEVWLEFDALKQALALRDGREVEMDTTSAGIVWHYVGETEWNVLISWDDLKTNLGIAGIEFDLSSKLDKNQGTENANRVMTVNSSGVVVPGEYVYSQSQTDNLLSGKLDNTADPATYVGRALVVTPTGEILPAGEFVAYNQDAADVNRVLTVDAAGHVKPDKIVYSVSETDSLLAAKVGANQGTGNAGKALVVGADGIVTTGDVSVDITGKLDVNQGAGNVGKSLIVGADGTVAPGDVDLSSRVAIDQGAGNVGKALVVGADGIVTTGDVSVDITGKLDVNQGAGNVGKSLIVGADGTVAPGDVDLSIRVAIDQGAGNVGKALVVGADGMVTTGDVTVDITGKLDRNLGAGNVGKSLIIDEHGDVIPGEVDLSSRVAVAQDSNDAGKVLMINDEGNVVPGNVDLSSRVAVAQGEDYAGKALVVDAAGNVTPSGDFVKTAQNTDDAGKFLTIDSEGNVVPGNVDLSSRVAVAQSTEDAGKVLLINSEGNVVPGNVDLSSRVAVAQSTEDAGKVLLINSEGNVAPGTIDLSGKVDVAQGVGNAGKALVVDSSGNVSATGEFLSAADLSGKVDIAQGVENAGKALLIDEEGNVTVRRINSHSLGLGNLAYKDKIKNEDVADDAAIERAKMAADITDTLYWIDRWRNSTTTLDDSTRYVMAIDETGAPSWFRVVVE